MSKDHRLPFELDERVDESLVAAHAGVPLVVELFRASGAAVALDEGVKVKGRRRGLKASEVAGSFLALWSAGVERCEDFARLREDAALAELMGHGLPASTTARGFLGFFHEDGLALWPSGERSSVPSESSGLVGLMKSNAGLVSWSQERTRCKLATLDVDASVYETNKRTTKRACDGRRGYQPVIVVWGAKRISWCATSSGTAMSPPGAGGNRRVIEKAVESLPGGVERVFVRCDSALYEHDVLRYPDDSKTGYAISARMGEELRGVAESVYDCGWSFWEDDGDVYRERAEVEFCPDDGDRRKVGPVARRHLVVRLRKRQWSLVCGRYGPQAFWGGNEPWSGGSWDTEVEPQEGGHGGACP